MAELFVVVGDPDSCHGHHGGQQGAEPPPPVAGFWGLHLQWGPGIEPLVGATGRSPSENFTKSTVYTILGIFPESEQRGGYRDRGVCTCFVQLLRAPASEVINYY